MGRVCVCENGQKVSRIIWMAPKYNTEKVSAFFGLSTCFKEGNKRFRGGSY